MFRFTVGMGHLSCDSRRTVGASRKALSFEVVAGCPSTGGQRTVCARSAGSCHAWCRRSIKRLSVQANTATLLLRQGHREFAQNVSNTITAEPPGFLHQLVALPLSSRANTKPHELLRERFAAALRGTAAPGLRLGSGASYRSRRVALRGVASQEAVLHQPRPNPSIEGTCPSKLGHAPHVKR